MHPAKTVQATNAKDLGWQTVKSKKNNGICHCLD